MTDETNIPVENADKVEQPPVAEVKPEAPPEAAEKKVATPADVPPQKPSVDAEIRMEERLERLGGEPAPAITPEEFARLQRAGQVHIDAQGRVRTTRRSDAEAGVSLRKRRAWYG
jgi:hypothetical protein